MFEAMKNCIIVLGNASVVLSFCDDLEAGFVCPFVVIDRDNLTLPI